MTWERWLDELVIAIMALWESQNKWDGKTENLEHSHKPRRIPISSEEKEEIYSGSLILIQARIFELW